MASEFIIPKGIDFLFTVALKDEESFLPKDLTNLNTATFTVIEKDSMQPVVSVEMEVKDALNGLLSGALLPSQTDLLQVSRGPKEDRYYLRALYQGTIEASFTDGAPPVFVMIEDVYVASAGQ